MCGKRESFLLSRFIKFKKFLRVVVPGENKTVVPNGHLFKNFGSHSSISDTPYFTAAAAIGIKRCDVDLFIKRLTKILENVKQQNK